MSTTCKHDWIGAGWGKLRCVKCHKFSTVKRVETAQKAASTAKQIRSSRKSGLLKDIFKSA